MKCISLVLKTVHYRYKKILNYRVLYIVMFLLKNSLNQLIFIVLKYFTLTPQKINYS